MSNGKTIEAVSSPKIVSDISDEGTKPFLINNRYLFFPQLKNKNK